MNELITQQQLTKITGRAGLSAKLLILLNECLQKYSINTPLRICHFLAQVLHESGCFIYFEEIASGEAYEGRTDLGNIQPGDGRRFKGRGLIQITGRYNYEQISKDLGIDFVKRPTYLAWPRYAVISAGLFWSKKNLNIYADRDDINAITLRVNGGFNGLENRKNWLNVCKSYIP